MSRTCPITGKSVMSGHNVSHANNKTKRVFLPNLQNVTLKSDILNEKFYMRISTRAIRTIDFHGGFDEFILTTRNSKLCTDLLKLKKRMLKAKA